MANCLHYNLEQLEKGRAGIAEVRDGLKEASSNLSSSLAAVRADWQTDAGNKFFESYDNEWEKQIEEYCKLLTKLEEDMKFAIDRYGSVDAEYKTIDL